MFEEFLAEPHLVRSFEARLNGVRHSRASRLLWQGTFFWDAQIETKLFIRTASWSR